jgi:uncharacterized membrane protein
MCRPACGGAVSVRRLPTLENLMSNIKFPLSLAVVALGGALAVPALAQDYANPGNRSGGAIGGGATVGTTSQTARMGEAPTEAPKYRTGPSPNDNGSVNVQAQNDRQVPSNSPGNRSGGAIGGGTYNYSPGYNSGWSGQGFGGPTQASQSDTAACQARFRSFDPASGTYLGFDGARHPCP